MNIGILGTGFGGYHARLLSEMGQAGQMTVFGRNRTKLDELEAAYGVRTTQSVEEVLQDPSIDLIDICLPSSLHREYAVRALKAGKHVFCETPVCLSTEDIQALSEAEQQYGTKVMVNQFIKFDPAYRYLYDSVQAGTYGRLLSVTLRRETPPLWGDLGLANITTNLMIHELDMLCWLLGPTEISSVWGTADADNRQSLVRAQFIGQHTYADIVVSSQMPESYPFTVSYEAYFEGGKLSFHESEDAKGNVDTALIEHTVNGTQHITLPKHNPYEQSLRYALDHFADSSSSIISLTSALQSMNLAMQLRDRLSSKGV
ncbi:Gfo/Idh/MocA family protein ['Paenibacillus yunnanensis' Narsing Rao et al. 2020]|uniref:Gfo/Idh/MocA family protein n=1 Tax=Paenibacillus tengchongensis TaxID=2608684 RepID=UPI00124BDD58|nr:Gfo/Idh/MocA family oxidoreductase [Paenibacillus tengchongensis]